MLDQNKHYAAHKCCLVGAHAWELVIGLMPLRVCCHFDRRSLIAHSYMFSKYLESSSWSIATRLFCIEIEMACYSHLSVCMVSAHVSVVCSLFEV